MKKYNRVKRLSILSLVVGMVYLTVAIIDLLTTGPSISIGTTIISFLGYFLLKRPYVLLSDSKMVVYHNTLISKQYNLNELKVISQDDKAISFEYQNELHFTKFKVYLNRLDTQDAISFTNDILSLMK